MANKFESTENLAAGYGQGKDGAKLIARRRPNRNSGAVARKTVTFGDGSAVTGNRNISLLTAVGLFVLWAVAEQLNLTDPTFFPGPVKTAEEFWLVLTTDSFDRTYLHQHVLASLQRILLGFGFGVLFGVPVGLAMGLSNAARAVFDPIIELFRPVPPLAFIPLLIIWFGIGEASKVIMLFFAAFFIMVIAARSGVLGVKLSKVHAAYSLGASKTQILRNVILPNALPEIFVGMRVALGVCWGTLVAAELIGADQGLGAMIWQARTFFRNGIVVFGIIVIGLIGVLLDQLMRKAEERFIPWRGRG